MSENADGLDGPWRGGAIRQGFPTVVQVVRKTDAPTRPTPTEMSSRALARVDAYVRGRAYPSGTTVGAVQRYRRSAGVRA